MSTSPTKPTRLPATSLGELVCRLNVLLDLENLATRRLRRRKSSKAEFLILARLYCTATHSLQQSELADYLQLAPSHVLKMTLRLARQSLVKRHKGHKPSRAVIVTLTAAGRKQYETSLQQGAREFSLFDVVWENAIERDQAIHLIQKVVDRLVADVELPGHSGSQ